MSQLIVPVMRKRNGCKRKTLQLNARKGYSSGNVFQQRFSDGNGILKRRKINKSIIEKSITDVATVSTFISFPFLLATLL